MRFRVRLDVEAFVEGEPGWDDWQAQQYVDEHLDIVTRDGEPSVTFEITDGWAEADPPYLSPEADAVLTYSTVSIPRFDVHEDHNI